MGTDGPVYDTPPVDLALEHYFIFWIVAEYTSPAERLGRKKPSRPQAGQEPTMSTPSIINTIQWDYDMRLVRVVEAMEYSPGWYRCIDAITGEETNMMDTRRLAGRHPTTGETAMDAFRRLSK